MKRQEGFSLLEFLVIVVIIGIIAAIAIPNLLAARRQANETMAQKILRDIHEAQETYKHTAGSGNYAPDLKALVEKKTIPIKSTDGNEAHGYVFSLDTSAGDAANTYHVVATPSRYEGVSATGDKTFIINSNGAMYEGKPGEIRIEKGIVQNGLVQ